MTDLQMRIEYDDHLDDVVDKVNSILAQFGMKFEDDNFDHDGFAIYTLKTKKE